ncbi:MAG TPA: hypothetical protein VGH28_03040 [Polyangiaceae bacterium]|jgi:membrane protein implicated in regulation of membrane protease activity
MTNECCGRRRVARTASSAIVPGLVLALAPKCPMCVAAWLSVFGVSAGVAVGIAPWLRPLAFALLGVTAVLTMRAWLRARRRSANLAACGESSLL